MAFGGAHVVSAVNFHWFEGKISEYVITEMLHPFTSQREEGAQQWDLKVQVATLGSLALSLC